VVFVETIVIWCVVNIFIFIHWIFKIYLVFFIDHKNVEIEISLSILTILKFFLTFLKAIDDEKVAAFNDVRLNCCVNQIF